MKKTLTMLLSLLLSVALIFTFVACNPSKDEGKSVTNSQIIESAFGALLDSEALHLSLKDVSASMGESALLETDPMEFKVGGDVYVRQTESGYDLVMDIELMVSFAETRTLDGSAGESEEIAYLDNTFVSFEVYYVDEQICTVMEDFSQVVIDGAAYEFFSDYQADPEDKDDYIYTDLIGDYSAVDGKIGNDVTETEAASVRICNIVPQTLLTISSPALRKTFPCWDSSDSIPWKTMFLCSSVPVRPWQNWTAARRRPQRTAAKSFPQNSISFLSITAWSLS